ncbi:DUF5309 family protein [Desulfurobacterium thermolithotrophum]|uniref:SU10 major capsid protein n=1 Tax=Desulfurobacterium thermolithotrophum TaxID=64160 RepID=UPI0013D4E3E7|nr:DUF5309 family protein [Desulfurobacterium thermolithotrophum]
MIASYDLKNVVRDLTEELSIVVQRQPTLISLIPHAAPNQYAHSPTHEWLEDIVSPEVDTLAADLDASATSMTVTDGTKFQPGMVLTFEGSEELVKVTAVSGNTLTVVRGYAETPKEAHSSGTEVKIIARPRDEGTLPGDDNPGALPGTEWNQTQIFDITVKVTRTAQNTAQYGIDNLINHRVSQGLQVISRRMNNAIIYGRRVKRVEGVEPGMMGGILYFLKQPGGNVVNAAGSDLTQKLLNDAIEKIALDGGNPNVLVCNTTQARKISAFNANNIVIQREDQTAGNFVARFVSDLPAGIITTIVVDTNFPKDKIAILDTSRLRLVPLRGSTIRDFDATPPGADFIARRILGEYTLEVRNAKQAHGLLEGLAY